MIIDRSLTDIDEGAMLGVLQANEAIPGGRVFQGCCPGFSGGGFGIDLWLIAKFGALVIQALDWGKDAISAIRGADEQTGKQAGPSEISAIADQLASRYPTTSRSQWENLLAQEIQRPAVPQLPPCPAGYIRDPATGVCLELAKPTPTVQAGTAGIPAWGWVALGGLGLLLLPRIGLFQPIRTPEPARSE